MATTRTDEDENLNVTSNDDDATCMTEKVDGMPFVREQDEAIAHNETSRDNMRAKRALYGKKCVPRIF